MIPAELLTPYLITNAFALGLLVLAYRRVRWVRWVFVALFGLAALFNASTVHTNPTAYDDFGRWVLVDGYRKFIRGWFYLHAGPMVLGIALGQLLVAALLTGPVRWRILGVVGGVIFFVAIAPLGVGAAFPASLLMALALIMMQR